MFGIDTLTTPEKIIRAKVKGYELQPFFGYILSYMKIKEDTTGQCPTMGVDARGNVYYNKKWINTLSEAELIGVLFHEGGHIAFDHLGRRGNRDPLVLNIANDAIINHMLTQQNITIPKQGIIPDYQGEFRLPGIKAVFNVMKGKQYKCSEELYDEIYKEVPEAKKGQTGNVQGDGSGKKKGQGQGLPQGFDEHKYGDKDGKDLSDEDAQGNKEKWKRVVAEAAANAKQRGKLPNGMERLVEDLLDSKVHWFHKLYKYLVDQVKSDYSYSVPGRRTYSVGAYMPKIIGEQIKVVVSIDTSGSMSKDDLSRALSEVYAIAQSFASIEIDIIVCDAEVHETYKITNYTADEIIKMSMKGGGGTSHKPIYEYVKEKMPQTKVLINLTDGWTDFPSKGESFGFDSLWVITSNGCGEEHIPFGEVIKIDE